MTTKEFFMNLDHLINDSLVYDKAPSHDREFIEKEAAAFLDAMTSQRVTSAEDFAFLGSGGYGQAFYRSGLVFKWGAPKLGTHEGVNTDADTPLKEYLVSAYWKGKRIRHLVDHLYYKYHEAFSCYVQITTYVVPWSWVCEDCKDSNAYEAIARSYRQDLFVLESFFIELGQHLTQGAFWSDIGMCNSGFDENGTICAFDY